MPALRWFGRRWRTASDDFSFSSALYFSILAASAALGLTRFSFESSPDPDACCNYHIPACPAIPNILTVSYVGLCFTDCVAALLFVVTCVLSFRGAVFESSKRSLVPYMLYLNAASIVVLLVLTSMCAKFAMYDGEMNKCTTVTKRVLQGTTGLNFVVCFLFILSFIIAYDPSGRKEYTSAEEYATTWWKRCRIVCCQCCSDPGEDDAFKDAAQVLAAGFRGYDMVPSDVAAGILLLHGFQERSRRIISDRVQFLPPLDGSRAERKSTQARISLRLTPEQRDQVRSIHRYSRYYMAAYGWMLYQFEHCCTALPSLCCFDACMCCRDRPGRHYGAKCYCDLTTTLKRTQIPEEDVLLSSWNNHLFKPVHFVAYDRETDAVVISVRGTMSLMDCVTDFAAIPEVITVDEVEPTMYDPADYSVHGGMLQSARYIWRSLEYNGILQQLQDGSLAEKPIVVLGHSLGAGVALILSVLMYSGLPHVRKRLQCIGYAPPGGVMSEALVHYCKSFTIGAFMGYDMIPRLAQHTFDSFRENLFDVMAASKTNKSLLFLNAMRTHHVAKTFHPSEVPTPTTSTESRQYREELRRGVCVPSEEPRKLYPCATLVHFRKAVTVEGCIGLDACSEDVYYPCFTGTHEVQELLSAPTMFSDHFPDRFFEVLEKTVDRLEGGQLERFYVDELPPHYNAAEEDSTTPMRFPSSWTAGGTKYMSIV